MPLKSEFSLITAADKSEQSHYRWKLTYSGIMFKADYLATEKRYRANFFTKYLRFECPLSIALSFGDMVDFVFFRFFERGYIRKIFIESVFRLYFMYFLINFVQRGLVLYEIKRALMWVILFSVFVRFSWWNFDLKFLAILTTFLSFSPRWMNFMFNRPQI